MTRCKTCGARLRERTHYIMTMQAHRDHCEHELWHGSRERQALAKGRVIEAIDDMLAYLSGFCSAECATAAAEGTAREVKMVLQAALEGTPERRDVVNAELRERITQDRSRMNMLILARLAEVLGISREILFGLTTEAGAEDDQESAPRRVSQASSSRSDSPEIRRLAHRLRTAKPATLRLVALLVNEMARARKNRYRD